MISVQRLDDLIVLRFCANSKVTPFMGHNVFMQWSTIQDADFVDEGGMTKIWSESNVLEGLKWCCGFSCRATSSSGDILGQWIQGGCHSLLMRWVVLHLCSFKI
jgi:hypothetical protein